MTTNNAQQQSRSKKRPNWGQIAEKAEYGQSLRANSPDTYSSWIETIRQMSNGADLGQIEPWNPFTLRETYFEGWADGDFGTLLNQLGEPTPFSDNKPMPFIDDIENNA